MHRGTLIMRPPLPENTGRTLDAGGAGNEADERIDPMTARSGTRQQ